MGSFLTPAATVVAAVLALGGVIYVQFRQRRQQETQAVAAEELDRAKLRRHEGIAVFGAGIVVSGRAVDALRRLERAIVAAEEAQFTVPGRPPRETDEIASAHSAARAALIECAEVSEKLSLFATAVTHEAFTVLVAALQGHVDRAPRPHLPDADVRAISELHSQAVCLLESAHRTAMGDGNA